MQSIYEDLMPLNKTNNSYIKALEKYVCNSLQTYILPSEY